jgi:hypothetical protein
MRPVKPEIYEVLGKYPVDQLLEKVKSLTDDDWSAWKGRQVFSHQRGSQTIVFLNEAEKNVPAYANDIYNKKYTDLFSPELDEIYSIIRNMHPYGGPKRVMLVNLPAGCVVGKHFDLGEHLVKCRRIHLPIQTDPAVTFTVDSAEFHIELGVLTEINNQKEHSVINNSEVDRIHLMVDWG